MAWGSIPGWRTKIPHAVCQGQKINRSILVFFFLKKGWKFQSLVKDISLQIQEAAAKLFQSCPTFCDPTDHSPPGSSVSGILQARILKWVAMHLLGDVPDAGIKPTSLTRYLPLVPLSRSWANPKMIKSKKYISQHNIIKCLKTKDKENILKADIEKLPIYEQDLNNCGFLISWRPKGNETTYSRYWKKKLVNPEFYSQWKYCSGMKGKSRYCQTKQSSICGQQTYPKD